MAELEEEKTKEEIKQLKSEITLNKNRTIIEWIKLLALVVGGFYVFFVIQKPGFILNKESSREDIALKRLKILNELQDEKDLDTKLLKVMFLQSLYPENENQEWFKPLKKETVREIKEHLKKQNKKTLNELIDIMILSQNKINSLDGNEKNQKQEFIELSNDIKSVQKEITFYAKELKIDDIHLKNAIEYKRKTEALDHKK